MYLTIHLIVFLFFVLASPTTPRSEAHQRECERRSLGSPPHRRLPNNTTPSVASQNFDTDLDVYGSVQTNGAGMDVVTLDSLVFAVTNG